MSKNESGPLFFGLIAGFLLAGGVLFFPAVSWAPPMIKMGVVNWERVVAEYEEFQRNIAEVEQRRETMIQFIEEQYGELEESKQLDAEIDEMYRETLLEIKKRREKVVQKAHRDIFAAIEEEAISRGYSLILSENEVLYASEDYTDMTGYVLKRLNSD